MSIVYGINNSMDGFHSAPNYIEGIGDEVLLCISLMLMVGSAAYLLFRNWLLPVGEPVGVNDTVETAPIVTEVSASRQLRRRTEDGPTVAAGGAGSCPICLAAVQLPVETNCGHSFCAGCLFAYRDHGSPLVPMKCPMCRQQVTLLFPCFLDSEQADADPSDTESREHFRQQAMQYNRRFSGEPRELLDYLRDLPTLLRHLWAEFFSENGLVLMFRVRVMVCFAAAVCYLLSPFDVLPEAFLGLFGLFDDVFVVILLVIYVSVMYRRYVAARQ